jgi:hypothetical protein
MADADTAVGNVVDADTVAERPSKRVRFDMLSLITIIEDHCGGDMEPPRIFTVPHRLVQLMKKDLPKEEDRGLVFTADASDEDNVSLAAKVCVYLTGKPTLDDPDDEYYDAADNAKRLSALPTEVQALITDETVDELYKAPERYVRHYMVTLMF